jgi:hypothetical protein
MLRNYLPPIDEIEWEVYLTGGSEIGRTWSGPAVVARRVGPRYDRQDLCWIGDPRPVGPDDNPLRTHADQIEDALRHVEAIVGPLDWRRIDGAEGYPYGLVFRAVQVIDFRPQLVAPWDIVRFDSPAAGRSLGYDDPADVGLYHVQCEGEWREAYYTLDKAVQRLSTILGFPVEAKRATPSGREDRWVIVPADDEVEA